MWPAFDDVRAYNQWQNEGIDLFADPNAEEILRREFQHGFIGVSEPGIPVPEYLAGDRRDLPGRRPVSLPVKVLHYKLGAYGYRDRRL